MPTARTSDEYLEARVSQLSGYTLGLTCYEGCTRPGSLDLASVARQHGQLQLRHLIAKLKCRWCKRRPQRVVIYDRPEPGGFPSVRVELQ